MKKKAMLLCAVLMGIMGSPNVQAFCGFYVAKADAKLFNKQSQVILVRDGNRSVITMANDFQGPVKDFAMVVPVPVVLKRSDIKTVHRSIFDKLDAYSAPRLVEYHDKNPCYVYKEKREALISMNRATFDLDVLEKVEEDEEKDYGVTIEAQYTVGEYDILILSAKESNGLKTWLVDNGYKIPASAEAVLEPYIKDEMKFFVVKVNLDEMEAQGADYLNPIQISFDSDKFMLPIRLGMANSRGEQDMTVYAFTRSGRVETTNYRTVKIPSNRNIPEFLKYKNTFGRFYVDLFNRAYHYERKKAVFLEYAWNVSPRQGVKCDPCVSPPPIFNEFAQAGVSWARNMNSQVFFTRLHVRYDRKNFPQDLSFQVTPNRDNYQGRYIITHPATGDLSCEAGQKYLHQLVDRRKTELDEMAALSGWDTDRHQDYVYQYSRLIEQEDSKRQDMPVAPVDASKPGNPGSGVMLILVLGALTYLAYRIPALRGGGSLQTA